MSALDRRELPEPRLDPARIERQWSRIRDRVEADGRARAWRLRPAWALASAAMLAGVWLGAFFVGSATTTAVLVEGSAVETADEPIDVRLAEGTTIEVAAQSRLALSTMRENEVVVHLDRGRARFDVAHRSSGAFRVRTTTLHGEDVEVRVVGTAFSVARGDDVRVDVERGRVEVRARGGVERLDAGSVWRLGPPDTPEQDASEANDNGSPTESGGGPSPTLDGSATEPRIRRAARSPSVPDARALFEQAREARQAGSLAEAARLYAEIVTQHGDDPRADVAAFELARLRMDHLGDTRGALGALDRALSGGGPFREDAMARRAVLLDRLGRERECRSARDAYLEAFPAGVHRAEVGALCP